MRPTLTDDAAQLRRLGGGDDQPAWPRRRGEAGDPLEHRLGALGRHRLKDLSAPYVHEEEKTPACRARRDDQVMDCRQVVKGFGADQRVHLKGQTGPAGDSGGLQGSFVGAGNPPEGIVALGR